MAKKPTKYTVTDGELVLVLEPDDGWYCVTSPFNPDIITQARTLDVARAPANFRAFADVISSAGQPSFLTSMPDGREHSCSCAAGSIPPTRASTSHSRNNRR